MPFLLRDSDDTLSICSRSGCRSGGILDGPIDVEDGAAVEDAIADFTAHRALIEQAKGVLMMTYTISAERAFDVLVWRFLQLRFGQWLSAVGPGANLQFWRPRPRFHTASRPDGSSGRELTFTSHA
jgi:hypothetical protein